ncbi:MAG: transporter [Myxococcales bacterium]|nr:transporter [Myxococcales bacterium]
MTPLSVLGLALVAAAEGPTISADRPGFSYSAAVVPAGHWQLELGMQAQLADPTVFTAPVLSARLGLTESIELQLGLPSLTIGPDGPDGLSNLALGLKVGDAPADWLAFSVVGLLSAPIGDAEVAEEAWQGMLAGNLELYFLGHGWVSLNTQLDTFTDSAGDRALVVTPSAALGWLFADVLNPFAQAYVRFADGQVTPVVGGGVAWLVTRRVQLDASADYDLDAEAVTVAGGVAVLW